MASEYTYLLTQKAEADLDGIVSYLSLVEMQNSIRLCRQIAGCD